MQIHSLRKLLVGSSLLLASTIASAQQKEILLWPDDAPGSEGKTGNEKLRLYEDEHMLAAVYCPKLFQI